MVNWMNVLKMVVLLAVILALYFIAAAPGISGKVFVGIIIAVMLWFYMRQEAKSQVINPVNEYYSKLLLLCKLNKNPKIRYLICSGDRNNQAYIKGLITGGPVNRQNKALLYKVTKKPVLDDTGEQVKDKDGTLIFEDVKEVREIDGENKKKYLDPRADAYVFSYTPNFGPLYNLPVIGGVMVWLFRREYLFCVYKKQLESQTMYGDIVIRGINTRFVGNMEFLNDWMLDVDVEMRLLDEEVDRVTLVDNLGRLPTRIRMAVDSNSSHLRGIDMKDDIVGGR